MDERDKIAAEVAAEWANKLIASRIDFTAGGSDQHSREMFWKAAQTSRLESLLSSAAETYLRRAAIDNEPDSDVRDMLAVRIAALVAAASQTQARIDELILQELSGGVQQ
jgi:hypothetical protein